jgi:uncharacterized protein YbcC (UPF0753/DUF2309 family)
MAINCKMAMYFGVRKKWKECGMDCSEIIKYALRKTTTSVEYCRLLDVEKIKKSHKSQI